MLDKLFRTGKVEKKVIEKIKKYIHLLCNSADCLLNTFKNYDLEGTYCVGNFEREADIIKREIISLIYEGAFLPYIRPNLLRFIEILEKAFDNLKHLSSNFRYLNLNLYKKIEEDCSKIAFMNTEICQILLLAFESLEKDNLREKNLAIRIYEKKIDEIKLDLIEKLKKLEIQNFWDGKILSDFLELLTSFSDIIEDASDHLHILELSLK
ncbi:MAG: TIGR00153 family protein [Thermodesulfobacteriaceae bacterium]|nr:TIGR00153 family protein [Thermodesulfobacteriaceae bacterium]MCX8041090.1 TIGR00153 family protein [Thermodesulfobacteriaceae bacterium]MDW8135531.1 TIGR00153 family protein [Thermodesulfobacterium sp.]